MSEPTYTEVENLALQLSPSCRHVLIEALRRSLEERTSPTTPSMLGCVKDHFPEDFDVDEALREIRRGDYSKWEERNRKPLTDVA